MRAKVVLSALILLLGISAPSAASVLDMQKRQLEQVEHLARAMVERCPFETGRVPRILTEHGQHPINQTGIRVESMFIRLAGTMVLYYSYRDIDVFATYACQLLLEWTSREI